MPRARSFAELAGPTPQSRSIGSGCRKSSSPPTGTSQRPSGLPTALATLASAFVDAIPTEIGRPTSARTRARSRVAMSAGSPARRRRPDTSRNASSIEMPSTIGLVSRKISNTAALASE
jgi:hypothetical protein